MKRLHVFSTALIVGGGVGVLMAIILTSNEDTIPQAADIDPAKKPIIIQSDRFAKSPISLAIHRAEQKLPQDVDDKFTSSISQKSDKASRIKVSNIVNIISNNKDIDRSRRSTDKTVTVQVDDTLFAISRRTGINVYKLARINSIETPFVIRPGQILHLADAQ
jgi:LysM repeat protein